MIDLAAYTDEELTAAVVALRERLRTPVEGMTDDDRKRGRVAIKMALNLTSAPARRRMIARHLGGADADAREKLERLLAECGIRT